MTGGLLPGEHGGPQPRETWTHTKGMWPPTREWTPTGVDLPREDLAREDLFRETLLREILWQEIFGRKLLQLTFTVSLLQLAFALTFALTFALSFA